MDTVSESSMAASASEASSSSTTTTPRSTSTPLSAPPSPAASPSHLTPSSNLPRISSIPVTISPPPPAFSSPRTGTPSVVGERGGWGGGGCVQCERCGEDSGVSEAGAAVVGVDGDFMVGAAMGTRFVLAFESELDEIMNKVAEMSGKYAKEVKVVISPYGICPLGAHIDHQKRNAIPFLIELATAFLETELIPSLRSFRSQLETEFSQIRDGKFRF
ncbi:hypothetical protein Syun_030223 [Stephania yunnanensis]|uniref:Uncharacterized protein n=1 Tax=Stephania yunnanensis TaxID=152371 RepID=A0AAP0E746_9MAGN